MEAIVFQTQNENYYLYSPLKKAILPLSKNVYDIISNDRNEGDETFRQLKQYGYLDKYTSSFDSYITGNTIQGVLVKLSQIIFETTTLCNLDANIVAIAKDMIHLIAEEVCWGI